MYKVFLVDDEIVVREGIRSGINWKDTNFLLVGEASDGEMAIPLIQDCKPDILITDIKMPFIDGLELSRIIKKTSPHIKIIILSGHDEFSYAKQAISIGTEEYILKPFSQEDLLQSLEKVARSIESEKQQSINVQKFALDLISEVKKEFQHFEQQPFVLPNDQQHSIAHINFEGESVADKLKYLQITDIDDIIKRYILMIGTTPLQISIIGSYLLVDLVVAFTKIVEESGDSIEEQFPHLVNQKFLAKAVTTIENFSLAVQQILQAILQYQNSHSVSRYSIMILKAKKFIDAHFNQHDLSLLTVAKEVHVSPNHFSSLFSKECGQSFIEYLTELRVEKAKKLLTEQQKRNVEVAYEVGFTDPHYFSFIFKKHTGVSPREFKEKKGVYENI